MTKSFSVQEAGKKGGHARWKGKSKKEKSRIMSDVRKKGLKNQKPNLD